MSSLKINSIVEYIKSRNEFPFDPEDVEEDLPGVLGFFGFCELLDKEEASTLKQALTALAFEDQEAEVIRMLIAEGVEL